MGSERLSHMFTTQDPSYKEDSCTKKHQKNKFSLHHSSSHTSGTHPVAVSNGSKSSSSPMIKRKRKTNSKYKKLIKLYNRQLSHIEATLNAIESVSKRGNTPQDEILLSSKQRLHELNSKLNDFHDNPEKQDHIHFDPLKDEIEQLITDLKSHKSDTNNSYTRNTVDYLVGFPLDVSDSEDDQAKTLIYF